MKRIFSAKVVNLSEERSFSQLGKLCQSEEGGPQLCLLFFMGGNRPFIVSPISHEGALLILNGFTPFMIDASSLSHVLRSRWAWRRAYLLTLSHRKAPFYINREYYSFLDWRFISFQTHMSIERPGWRIYAIILNTAQKGIKEE